MPGSLIISDEIKRKIVDRLNNLPRPTFLAGRISVVLEFNCRPDGSIGDINIETHTRELLAQPKRGA